MAVCLAVVASCELLLRFVVALSDKKGQLDHTRVSDFELVAGRVRFW